MGTDFQPSSKEGFQSRGSLDPVCATRPASGCRSNGRRAPQRGADSSGVNAKASAVGRGDADRPKAGGWFQEPPRMPQCSFRRRGEPYSEREVAVRARRVGGLQAGYAYSDWDHGTVHRPAPYPARRNATTGTYSRSGIHEAVFSCPTGWVTVSRASGIRCRVGRRNQDEVCYW